MSRRFLDAAETASLVEPDMLMRDRLNSETSLRLRSHLPTDSHTLNPSSRPPLSIEEELAEEARISEEKRLEYEDRGCCFRLWDRVKGLFFTHNLFWSEKYMLFLDYIQYLALFWSWPWPYPFTFLKWMQPILLINFDVVAYRGSEIPALAPDLMAVEMFNIPVFLLLWCLVPFVPGLLYLLFKLFRLPSRQWMERVCTFFTQLFFLPAVYHLTKIGVCQSDGAVFFECQLTCEEGKNCLIRQAAAGGSLFLLLLGFILFFYIPISRQLIYSGEDEHEKYIRSKEAEFVMMVNQGWKTRHFHLFASFRRRAVYFKIYHALVKVAVVGVLVGFSFDRVLTAIALLVVLSAPLALYLLFPPYRMSSSNFTMQIFGWITVLNALFGYLLVSGVRSPLLVASVVVVWLAFFNGLAIFVFLLLTLFWIFKEQNWSVTRKSVEALKRGFRHFVTAIEDASRLLEKVRTQQPLFVRADLIAKRIENVHSCWLQAKFEEHPLERTLAILLEELVMQYNRVKDKTLLPNPVLEEALGDFRERIEDRSRELGLVSKRNRRILLKLLAVRFFSGNLRSRMNRQAVEEEDERMPGEDLTPGTARWIDQNLDELEMTSRTERGEVRFGNQSRFLQDVELEPLVRKPF